jgi:hypothetical protein
MRSDDIRQRYRPGKFRDHFLLGSQLQMQVQEHDQADADPEIQNKIHAAPDADEFRHARAF